MEAVFRARGELAERKARQVFEEEHRKKRSFLQTQLEGTARRMWTQYHVLRNAAERISGAETLTTKELKYEVTATSSGPQEVYDQCHRYYREWSAE